MSKNIISTVVLCLALLPLAPLGAATREAMSDTLAIRFPVRQTDLDLSFADNGAHWQTFVQAYRERYAFLNPAAVWVDIYAGASPEGAPELNRRLGERRGNAVAEQLRKTLGLPEGNIHVVNEGARWQQFRTLVAATDRPWRDDVLHIIDHPDSVRIPDIWAIDPRETRLRALGGGAVWPELDSLCLAPLRSGATAVLSWAPGRDTLVVRDTLVIVHEHPAPGAGFAIPFDQYVPGQPLPDDAMRLDQQRRLADSLLVASRDQRGAFRIGTNLLLWGAGAPNVEAEVSLGEGRWSLVAEVLAPWWTWDHNSHASQALNAGLELRRYMGRRDRHHRLDGWHLGLAAAAGFYDLEWKGSDGYQGEHVLAYFNLGWQHRYGKRRQWAFDAALGLGALATRYRHYVGSSVYPVGREEAYDDHLMFRNKGQLVWPGAVHANLSIGYVLPFGHHKPSQTPSNP